MTLTVWGGRCRTPNNHMIAFFLLRRKEHLPFSYCFLRFGDRLSGRPEGECFLWRAVRGSAFFATGGKKALSVLVLFSEIGRQAARPAGGQALPFATGPGKRFLCDRSRKTHSYGGLYP